MKATNGVENDSEEKNKCIQKYEDEIVKRYQKKLDDIEKESEYLEIKHRANKYSGFDKTKFFARETLELLADMKKEKKLLYHAVNRKNNTEKYKKKVIPKALRIAVWNKYFTEDVGKAKCMCCEITDITQLKFHCGHIIAESNEGPTDISNLVPVCEDCNRSMYTTNLIDFKKIICNKK